MDLKRVDWLLCKGQEAGSLTSWEQDFLADMIERRERQAGCFSISDRQMEILEQIGGKD